jgi:hypothetical protein
MPAMLATMAAIATRGIARFLNFMFELPFNG